MGWEKGEELVASTGEELVMQALKLAEASDNIINWERALDIATEKVRYFYFFLLSFFKY